jgi:hypothetical protein
LTTGEVAVVTGIHAPDPYRPRVRVLFDQAGTRLALPLERNLWEHAPDGSPPDSIVSPVEPAEFDIDPLTFVPTRGAA